MDEKQRKRIKNYYNRTQYEPANFNDNTPNLFDETIEIFNPVKDITKALISAAIKDLQTKKEELQKVWDFNKMQAFSKKICKEMYLQEVVFVEAIRTQNDEIIYILHEIDNIEHIEQFGELIQFKIDGEYSYFNEKGEELTVSFSREYKKLENGKVKKVEIIDNQVFEAPFMLDKIPVVKFRTDSNIVEALNIIDKINVIEAYIHNVLDIHGDPMVHAGDVGKFADINGNEQEKKNAEALETFRFKKKRFIYTKPGEKTAFFKYIELSKPLISEMQSNIERLEKRLSNLFPEFLLVDTKTQNVSQETYTMKNNGLRTKILSFRTDFLKGLVDLDNSALELMGRVSDVTEDDYTYLDPFEEAEKLSRLTTIEKMADVIAKLKNIDEEMALSDKINTLTAEVTEELEGMYE